MMKRRTARQLASAQFAGGVPVGNVIASETLFVCQKCGDEYRLRSGGEPCAFCDGCKDDVLTILARAVLDAKSNRRRE